MAPGAAWQIMLYSTVPTWLRQAPPANPASPGTPGLSRYPWNHPPLPLRRPTQFFGRRKRRGVIHQINEGREIDIRSPGPQFYVGELASARHPFQASHQWHRTKERLTSSVLCLGRIWATMLFKGAHAE